MGSRDPKGRPEIVTVPELARILRCTPRTLYEACSRGEVAGAFQIGRRWRVNLDAFYASTGSPE